jgi:hypothetical protein
MENFREKLGGNYILYLKLRKTLKKFGGRDSSVDTATRYGLNGPGIESRWREGFSTPVQTAPSAHPASYTMGNGYFPGVKQQGRGVDHPTYLASRLKKEYIYPSTQ